MKNVCWLMLLLPLFSVQAQQDNGDFFRDSAYIMRRKLVKPQLKFDNRLNFYGSQGLPITGVEAGVLLADRLRLTLGYYNMNNRLKDQQYVKNDTSFGTLIHLEYGSLNTELIYKDTRFLSLGMPLEIAAGVNSFRDKNITSDKVLETRSGALIFVNFGLSLTFKPMRFIGLRGLVGYRKVAFNQVQAFNFDGLFTSIGLNLDVHEFVTDFKMFRLKKRYRRGNNIQNAVDIFTN